MLYRNIGKRVKEQYSALGLGCMRFPMRKSAEGMEIDIPHVRSMFEAALDQGINYIDTAYPYHDGESETIVGEYLCKPWRDRFALATKMPVWEVKETADFERLFQIQLERLQTDYIDFYLVHAIDMERWKKVRELGITEWLQEKQQSGQIRYKGFSFHGPGQDFIDIIDDWEKEWDFCQIQYNYMDEENQAGRAGLEYAAGKGIGCIIMEPLLGGSLINPVQSVMDIWKTAPGSQAPVAWALQWLWDQKDVAVVLSGMSSLKELEENIGYAGRFGTDSLTSEERELFPKVKQAYEKIRPVPCTFCQYCLPCPHGVAIPRVFGLYNDARAYSQKPEIRQRQYSFLPEEARADKCVECGECMDKCPQRIHIIDSLKEAQACLTEAV